MPLVRISYRKGRHAGFGRDVGEVVYDNLREHLNAPENNRFQLITEHDGETLIYDPEYLGVERTDDVIFIQVFLNEGRTVEMKKAFYRGLADELNERLGVRRGDVQVNLVDVKKENWSVGNGEAQYAD